MLHPQQARDFGRDLGPEAVAVRAGLMLAKPNLCRVQGGMAMLADQDRGQFNDFLLGHPMHVKPGAQARVPRPASPLGPAAGVCRSCRKVVGVAAVAVEGARAAARGNFVSRMQLSVVIPVKNEAGNIAPLVSEIAAALEGRLEYEIVYVDDGSDDATAGEIRRLQAASPRLRLVQHRSSCGQSAAIRSGIKAACGAWIATLDGDGQNDPADIPALWAIAQESPALPPLLVAGHRAHRQDSWSKRRASRIANAVRRWLLRDDTPDTGCGLKLFRRDLFLDLPYFDHMHRFLPALVLREGGVVRSVPVNHRPRERGVSKYGVLDRLGVGITDLLGVMWLLRRAERPALVEEEFAVAGAGPRDRAPARQTEPAL
jgi:dolichol-phosphate mannosyltransferase